jgi:hypothetical protein
VFDSKNSKEDAIKEMKELFHEKSEELINMLWNLTEKYYNIQGSSSTDLLEEIYKEKQDSHSTKSDKKGRFPSQIVNPNSEERSGKQIFNSAIDKVRGEKGNNYRSNYNNYNDNRRGGYRDRDYRSGGRNYDDRRGYERDDRRRSRRDDPSVTTVDLGGRQLVIKKKGRDNQPRSRSQERERERSRDMEDNREDQGQEQYDQRYEQEEYYQPHHQDRYMPRGRGYYNPRRMQRGGRYPPGPFMRPPPFMTPDFGR